MNEALSCEGAPRFLDENVYDLGQLSPDEHLFLWRRRQKATNGRLMGRVGSSMSRAEAAAELRIDPATYARLESGARPSLQDEEICTALEALGVLSPTLAELCFIARRRSGRPLREIEAELGVSRVSFHKWERAGNPRLVDHWEAQGFRFPHGAVNARECD